MTNPYDRAEQRPASGLDPDPLYVSHHEEVRRAIVEGQHRRYGWIVFASVVVVLAILAVTLLLAAPRAAPDTGTRTPVVGRGQLGASLPVASPAEREASGTVRRATVGIGAPMVGAPRSDASVSQVAGNTGPPEPPIILPDTATSITGTASWYCGGGSACTRGYPEGTMAAAAGPALRVGDWRGRIVRVCADRCVRVSLVDWCACPRRVIDLYRLPFSKLAPPSRGLVRVEVSWGGRSTAPLPPTGTE